MYDTLLDVFKRDTILYRHILVTDQLNAQILVL